MDDYEYEVVPKSISEEICLFSFGSLGKLYMKDLVAFGAIGGFFWMLSSYVVSPLLIPYTIFAVCTAIYSVLPAKSTNSGKRNWEAIILLLSNGNSTAWSLVNREVGKL